jgi:hypothetical protein
VLQTHVNELSLKVKQLVGFYTTQHASLLDEIEEASMAETEYSLQSSHVDIDTAHALSEVIFAAKKDLLCSQIVNTRWKNTLEQIAAINKPKM